MQAKTKKFYKYQGAGNDFIIVQPQFFDLENQRTNQNTFSEAEKIIIVPKVIELCHRNFGIGADGLLIVSQIGQIYKMSVFNSDGSMGANCGNGLRCVATFLHTYKHQETHFTILTDSGSREVIIQKTTEGEYLVQINLGTINNLQEISLSSYPQFQNSELLKQASLFQATLGNKHLILYLPQDKYRQIASLNAYTNLALNLRRGNENINFCVVQSENQISIVTCQFGAGVTLACGTGSTASAYVGWITGRLKRRVVVRTRGGILQIEGRKTEKGEELMMKGPAKIVFSGNIF